MFGLRTKKQSNRRPDLLVVGLGNPGGEYDGTRHNVGFAVLDELAKRHRFKLSVLKHKARYTTWEFEGRAVLAVKPMTFMNLSGHAVATLARAYTIGPEDILVVADDLDLPTGTTKMKPKGGSGGHNGHKSIAASLGSDAYPRIKIGIGKAGETVDHVLSRFKPDEQAAIQAAIERAATTCEVFVKEGLDAAMRHCNSD
jgi:PTH1 family peptidyl-tRNA hydrolase